MSGPEVMRIIFNRARGPGSNCREATVWFRCNYGLLNVASVEHGRLAQGYSHIGTAVCLSLPGIDTF